MTNVINKNQLNAVTTPTASTVGYRDAYGNLYANSHVDSFLLSATDNGTITYTAGTAKIQRYYGSNTEIIKMANATTCSLGQSWIIINESSATIPIKDNMNNQLYSLLVGGTIEIVCVDISNAAGGWECLNDASRAADNAVVHLSGTESITGAKTFSLGLTAPSVTSAAGLTLAASGTNQSVTLTPTGTGASAGGIIINGTPSLTITCGKYWNGSQMVADANYINFDCSGTKTVNFSDNMLFNGGTVSTQNSTLDDGSGNMNLGGTFGASNFAKGSSFTVNFTGPCTISNVPIYYQKINNVIFLTFSSNAWTGTSTVATFFQSSGTIPVGYRPATDINVPVMVWNGSQAWGEMVIHASGYISIYASFSGANFNSSGTVGFNSLGYQYT